VSEVVERFLRSLETRDYDALADCFADASMLRALVPTRVREEQGAEAIAARFRFWLDEYEDYQVVDSDVERFADHEQLHYRIRAVDPEDGPGVLEQRGYAIVDDGRIATLNVVCSGFRPDA
jgi:SnoaL-like domain